LFSDISAGWWISSQGWLTLAGFNHCNQLIPSPIHSELEVNKDFTVTNHKQQGRVRRTAHICAKCLSTVSVVLLVARRDVLMLDYSFNLLVQTIACCVPAVVKRLVTLALFLKGKIHR